MDISQKSLSLSYTNKAKIIVLPFIFSEGRSLSDGTLQVKQDDLVQRIKIIGDEISKQVSKDRIMSRTNVSFGHNGKRVL